MNPRLCCEFATAVRERGVAQFLEFIHRRKLGLKRLVQVSVRIRGDLELCKIKAESSHCCYDHHDRGEQPGAKTPYFFISRFTLGFHGKSTCSVWPFLNSTGFSRVVLLSIHAFSV